MQLKIETTADGSPTLYRKDIDEHYHSVKGAIVESQHIYIGLGWRKATEKWNPVKVYEIGFGTGLNAALTAKAALETGINTIYTSIERYPLPKDMIEGFIAAIDPEVAEYARQVNAAPWNYPIEINPYFKLMKIEGDLLTAKFPEAQNVIYFDAFAPEKQPEMWNEKILKNLYDSLAPEGVLTTYCAKGNIRRLLQFIGFTTERLPGPPGGKREVLRAVKPL